MPTEIYSKINNQILLTINRKSEITENRIDICSDDKFLQISTKKLNKNINFKAHKHLPLQRITDITQEAWIVLEGKIRASFYDLDDSLIYETDLISGDCAVVYNAGHSFEVIYDNTILYEVKNGPYYGQQKDKVFI